MDTRSISDFFAKYAKLQAPERSIRAALEDCLGCLSAAGSIHAVEIRGGVLYVRADASLRHYLFVNKVKILSALKERLPGNSFTDLR